MPVLVMVTGYARWLTARLIPSRVAEDLFAGWWQLPHVLAVDGGLPAGAGAPDPEHVHSTLGRLDWGEGRLHLPPASSSG
jgi:hypothetical protein